MGYAYYGTPIGPAGYGVEDICNLGGCETKIDRGLAYLCGDQSGMPSEGGCGKWFCREHLFMPPEAVRIAGGGLCEQCLIAWEDAHPNEVFAEEARFQEYMMIHYG